MKFSPLIFFILFFNCVSAQGTFELNRNWQFRKQGTHNWYKASVPGTIHTDLLANKLIPDPFYRDNESKVQWVDSANWEYRSEFNIDKDAYLQNQIELDFEGLDTYADVYLNKKLILRANNMFRGWRVDVKRSIRMTKNELLIIFHSAQLTVDSIARSKLPRVLPDNSGVYARKAQFQFGWDWGPKLIGCGIWRRIKLVAGEDLHRSLPVTVYFNNIQLIQKKDTVNGREGNSFEFRQENIPVYMKGANWIPADIFLPRVTRDDYRKWLLKAKEANMNMLRVWGGGVYEDDAFYELCDSLKIFVWQDFMFAGGMYPGDDSFFSNVKEEVKYQVERLRQHSCIAVWCGNNEIDEAWQNWGWQNQFNLHGKDSAKIWDDYKRLFQDSLKKWVDEFDGTRAYISTSPMHGWGHKESFTEGDSHYWGLWWGLEDWEAFENKTGRFVSEYGMQAMPTMATINSYTSTADRKLFSTVINAHQKATEGFKKLNYYLHRYFIDSSKIKNLSLEDYTYLTQCLQYYILKNSIAVHRNTSGNSGTLLWQLNDCWPVTSWSIVDYYKRPKAAWYAVKEAYRDDVMPVKDQVTPKELNLKKTIISFTLTGNKLRVESSEDAKFIELSKDGNTSIFSENYFDLKKGKVKVIEVEKQFVRNGSITNLKARSLSDIHTKLP
jgi:beta-mannosidase